MPLCLDCVCNPASVQATPLCLCCAHGAAAHSGPGAQSLWRYCLRQRPAFPHMYVAYHQLRAQACPLNLSVQSLRLGCAAAPACCAGLAPALRCAGKSSTGAGNLRARWQQVWRPVPSIFAGRLQSLIAHSSS